MFTDLKLEVDNNQGWQVFARWWEKWFLKPEWQK